MDVKQFDVGPITAADVEEAISNKLAIINFNQPISKEIQTLIHDNDVRLYNHDVIYKLFDHVETGKIHECPYKFHLMEFSMRILLNFPKKDEFLWCVKSVYGIKSILGPLIRANYFLLIYFKELFRTFLPILYSAEKTDF